jgi:photosystem II stability/assembly factor-like uncharacterized protein
VEVVAVGAGGTILYSSDSGSTWSTAVTTTTASIYSLSQYNTTHIMAAGDGSYVASSKNGGVTWTTRTVFSTANISIGLHSISLISSTEAYVAGQNGEVYKTTNFGYSWSLLATTNAKIYSLSFLNSMTAVAGAGSAVYILVSS